MKWFYDLRERIANPDKFWRDYHIKRREERLAYWRMRREEAIADTFTANSAIAYYEAKLAEASSTDIQEPV